ncbi:hypothetical protein ABT097_10210 [Streptomyces sp. NPDC002225]|uniref:hypothetical protein n=1 Tax=Streptomyces sp. NPDC002225 TaxID=3154413 RepID=UPI003320CFA1
MTADEPAPEPVHTRGNDPDTGPTLLAYEVNTTPVPLTSSTVGESPHLGTVTVRISLPGSTPVDCDGLLFVFPVGDAEHDLIAKNSTRTISPALPTGTWRMKPSSTGRFNATPRTAPYRFEPGALPVEFDFPDLEINSAPGNATLTVQEKVKGATQDTTNTLAPPPALPKAPAGFTLRNFRPAATSVYAGSEVTLSWDTEPKGHTLTLAWEDQTVDVTSVRSHTVRVYQDTVFELRASKPKTAPPLYRLQTTVTVANPWLHAGDLTATGTVDILQPAPDSHSPIQDVPQLELPQSRMYHDQPVHITYQPETDGLLTGTLRAHTPGARGSLAITVTAPGSPQVSQHYEIRCHGPGNADPRVPGEILDVPVPARNTVLVTWNLTDQQRQPDSDGAMPASLTTSLRWQPWGTRARTQT